MMRRRGVMASAAVLLALAFWGVYPSQRGAGPPARFGFGRPATVDEMNAWAIAVRPDGKGLPPGRRTARDGLSLYASHCASRHRPTPREGPFPRLVGRPPPPAFPVPPHPAPTPTTPHYLPP